MNKNEIIKYRQKPTTFHPEKHKDLIEFTNDMDRAMYSYLVREVIRFFMEFKGEVKGDVQEMVEVMKLLLRFGKIFKDENGLISKDVLEDKLIQKFLG